MDKVREKVAAMGLNEQVIPFSARLERKLIDMSPEDAKAYCEKYGFTFDETTIDTLIESLVIDIS